MRLGAGSWRCPRASWARLCRGRWVGSPSSHGPRGPWLLGALCACFRDREEHTRPTPPTGSGVPLPWFPPGLVGQVSRVAELRQHPGAGRARASVSSPDQPEGWGAEPGDG